MERLRGELFARAGLAHDEHAQRAFGDEGEEAVEVCVGRCGRERRCCDAEIALHDEKRGPDLGDLAGRQRMGSGSDDRAIDACPVRAAQVFEHERRTHAKPRMPARHGLVQDLHVTLFSATDDEIAARHEIARVGAPIPEDDGTGPVGRPEVEGVRARLLFRKVAHRPVTLTLPSPSRCSKPESGTAGGAEREESVWYSLRLMARRVGRYQLHEPIASGGMAVVHLGRIVGPIGFSRTVAIKRLHPHLATDPEFVTMFLDEARLAARVQHPNVVATLDVVASEGELFLVMDYVLGASLSQLLRWAKEAGSLIPPAVASSIIAGALYGLHAAHEARDEGGELLAIVHRDVSPQNILVGVDGVARVVDFGVAKAASRAQSTRDDQIKGKLAYMAPEQISRKMVDRRADVYAAGVVLWEALAARRLFVADDVAAVAAMVLEGAVAPLTGIRPDLTSGIDDVVKQALAREPAVRFGAAIDFAAALEAAIQPAPQREVGAWVARIAGKELDGRRKLVSVVERRPFAEGLAERKDDQAIEGLLVRPKTPEEAKALATALTSKLSLGLTASEVLAPPSSTPMPGEVAHRRAKRLWVGGALAFALAAGGGAFGAFALRHAADAGVSLPPAPAVVVPRAANETGPAATPSASSAPEPAATIAAAAPSSESPHNGTSHPRLSHQHVASAPPSPAKSCDPPFALDPNGVKRFKPWCI